jgi:hypothetical protein
MILNHCDNLIQEAIDPSIPLKLIGKGLRALIHRYTSLPTLSLKFEEFIKVLKHPSKHADELWNQKLTRIIEELKTDLTKVDQKISSLSMEDIHKELPGINLDEVKRKYPDNFMDWIRYALHRNVVTPSKFEDVTSSKSLSNSHLSDMISYLRDTSTEEIIQQINNGELKMFSNIGLKYTEHLDSLLSGLSRISIPYFIEYFFGEKIINSVFPETGIPIEAPVSSPTPLENNAPHYGMITAASTIPFAVYGAYKHLKTHKKRDFLH